MHAESEERPIALQDRAIDNLRFIRDTMERASSFTAVSGVAGVLMGVSALVAAWFASHAGSVRSWLAIWSGDALLAIGSACVVIGRGAPAAGMPVLSGPGLKFGAA